MSKEYVGYWETIPYAVDITGRPVKMPRVTSEPVVRCRDCEHYDDVAVSCEHFAHAEFDKALGCYVDILEPVEPDGFCKWGERREAS